jgi:hypothetical protein
LIGVGYRASTEAVALRRAKELATRRPY